MNAPALIQPRGLAFFEQTEAEQLETLRNSLYPGATDASIKLVIGWCRASGKDPMKRPVHIVPMSVKKPGTKSDYEWRDVLMPGIGDYRTDAARTGEYAGLDEAKFGPDVSVKLGGADVTYPEWCEITVYRMVGGMRCPFSSGRVYWTECYATAGRDTTKPNAMWLKRPRGQLEKCAEAMALRRAFPEAVGSQPVREEMEGRVIDVETVEAITEETTEKASFTMPRAKSEQPAERVEEPAQPRAEAPKPEPKKEEARPASAGQITMIRKRLGDRNEAEFCKEFGVEKIDGISVDTGNAMLKKLREATA